MLTSGKTFYVNSFFQEMNKPESNQNIFCAFSSSQKPCQQNKLTAFILKNKLLVEIITLHIANIFN